VAFLPQGVLLSADFWANPRQAAESMPRCARQFSPSMPGTRFEGWDYPSVISRLPESSMIRKNEYRFSEKDHARTIS
jgi:hypothetical protein